MLESIAVHVGLLLVPVLLSITVHEWGHARVALAYGDDTAKLLGRVSLNPLAHLDPIGAIGLFFGPLGWGKPVPVDPAKLRRWGSLAVALAGVSMNLLLAFTCAIVLDVLAIARVSPDFSSAEATPLSIGIFMLSLTMMTNIGLLLFNLLPLYPLDGHQVVRELLPWRQKTNFMDFQRRYGGAILGMLIFSSFMARREGGPSLLSFISKPMFPLCDLMLNRPAEVLFYGSLHRYMPYLQW